MTHPSTLTGDRIAGVLVPLARSQAESPWNVLAYATPLKGRGPDVELTAADFASCVANFVRWGREVPVVLYHADTDATAHPDARKAHAYIVEMRVGTMQRRGATCATLEGRFRWINASTRADVESGALCGGSITIVQGGKDEETNERVGSFLWSFSLTNNPALMDLPRIAAEATGGNDPTDVPSVPRGSAALEIRMTTQMMALAACLGHAAATEEDAWRHIAARAEESIEVRRALGLALTSGVKDVGAKITELHSESAKVAVVTAENAVLKAAESERSDREVLAHVEALSADPTFAKARPALEAFARSDYAAFSKAYPKPVPLSAAALALTSRVTALGGERLPAAVGTPATSHTDRANALALDLRAKTPSLSFRQALSQASAQIMAEVQS